MHPFLVSTGFYDVYKRTELFVVSEHLVTLTIDEELQNMGR